MKIQLEDGQRFAVEFPDAFLTKHIAILGTTGAGKTSVAKAAIVEPLLREKQRVHIIDPKTDWWGLRLNRKGKPFGSKVIILGGEKGDYPLRVTDAQALAEALALSSDSVVFDTSEMTVEDRSQFFIKYAETIQRKNRGPLNIVIDEAHLFMPQAGSKVGGLAPRMLHAGNNLMSLGRSKGLRIALITQRPQKLHKDSLTLVQSLIALRMMHPLDVNSIKVWMAEQADPVKGEQIISTITTLKPGEGWAWSPTDAFMERIQFPLPQTFDSSKAPELGDADVPVLEPLDMEALTGKLAKLAEEKAANDPAKLKARIRELEKKGGDAGAVYEAFHKGIAEGRAAEATAFKAGYLDGFSAGYRVGNENGIGAVQELIEEMTETVSNLTEATTREIAEEREKYFRARGIELKYDPPKTIPESLPPKSALRGNSERPASKAPVSKPLPTAGGNGTLSRPQQKIVDALELWHALGHEAPTREQVAAIAGYSPSSGGYGNLIGSLTKAGVVVVPEPGRIALHPDEIKGSRNIDLGDAGRELLGHLSAPQRKLIEAMTDGPISRATLGGATGYSPTSGGFGNLIGSLTTLGIFRVSGPGLVALSDWAAEILK